MQHHYCKIQSKKDMSSLSAVFVSRYLDRYAVHAIISSYVKYMDRGHVHNFMYT